MYNSLTGSSHGGGGVGMYGGGAGVWRHPPGIEPRELVEGGTSGGASRPGKTTPPILPVEKTSGSPMACLLQSQRGALAPYLLYYLFC